MYLFYMVVKYALHWIVIAFKDSGFVYMLAYPLLIHMIAMYKGTPYFCSFLFTYTIPIMQPAQ